MLDNSAILCAFPDQYFKSISNFDSALLQELILRQKQIFLALNKPVFYEKETNELCQHLTEKQESPRLNAKGIAAIFQQNPDIEHLVLFSNFTPFFDTKLFTELAQIHSQYAAEFTHGENIPSGIMPVIINRSAVEVLEELVEPEQLDEQKISLPSFILKNINKFAVESHFVLPDLRLLRLDYSCISLRSMVETRDLLGSLSQENENVIESLNTALEKNPALLFNNPSFIQLELTTQTFRKFKYAGPSNEKAEATLSSTNWESVMSLLSGLETEFSVELAGPGEPLLHPEILNISKELLKEEKLEKLFITTSVPDTGKLLEIVQADTENKVVLIIECNGTESFDSLYELDTYEEFKTRLQELASNLNEVQKARVYLQTLKMIDNEKDIDELYELADTLGIQYLLQKYNSFSGQLPERRVSDMTPLKRSFCWHLRRDIVIKADGTVPFCKQDCLASEPRGNLKEKNGIALWASQREHWIKNYGENLSISSFCSSCDEYYTFNA